MVEAERESEVREDGVEWRCGEDVVGGEDGEGWCWWGCVVVCSWCQEVSVGVMSGCQGVSNSVRGVSGGCQGGVSGWCQLLGEESHQTLR
ncbi:hypothetical protein Hamer_G014173 [Homarus americanus]|uniref:Uncharacterized protein n=1 Tax=Homarus americanus TaxID=6706 RepID=A0A8J5JNR5_HOMAM|nr:hypothetical protein Hamer_G014173 [Homarus americanus]